MKPTDILKQEHRVIEQVLDCLQAIAECAIREGVLDGSAARQALDFFQKFADTCHHGKEEHQLFPLLESRGLSPQCGPTAVMRSEHEQGRHHIWAMRAAVDWAEAGDVVGLEHFAHHAQAYVQLLREHIAKEDHCLFAIAEQVLTPADQQMLERSFATVEEKDMGPGTHEKYLRLADELAERFHVSRAVPLAVAHVGCGHHG